MRGDDNSCANTAKSPPKMPRSIWALGFVSMLMDISSEMIHALLPLYMVTVLGTSVVAVGVIEGIAVVRDRSPILVVDANGSLGDVTQQVKLHRVAHHAVYKEVVLVGVNRNNDAALALAKQKGIRANLAVGCEIKTKVSGHGRLHECHKKSAL